jgi:hypothetical protein
MMPCIQEERIKALEDRERDTSNDITSLTTTINNVMKKLDTLIKVLLVIAAKVALGLIIFTWYLIKTFLIT